MARQKARYHFDLRKQRECDGTIYYSFVLCGKHIAVRPTLNESALWLVDIVRNMPNEIESASGLKQRVKLVLKLYAKIPQKTLTKHREKKRYERLLRGAPAKMILTD